VCRRHLCVNVCGSNDSKTESILTTFVLARRPQPDNELNCIGAYRQLIIPCFARVAYGSMLWYCEGTARVFLMRMRRFLACFSLVADTTLFLLCMCSSCVHSTVHVLKLCSVFTRDPADKCINCKRVSWRPVVVSKPYHGFYFHFRHLQQARWASKAMELKLAFLDVAYERCMIQKSHSERVLACLLMRSA